MNLNWSGCAHAGHIDAWIDQSWSGAWQDVPSRDTAGLGWTHQLAYILAHRAQIVGGNRKRPRGTPPCKHYVLHETFDAYEGWDTLGTVPLKLAWGVWAYNHAAFRDTATGRLVASDGQYVSWANSWSAVYAADAGGHSGNQKESSYLDRPLGLLTRPAVAFLVAAMNAAVESAQGLEAVFGPTMVYNRPGLAQLMASASGSGDNVGEFVDEQASGTRCWPAAQKTALGGVGLRAPPLPWLWPWLWCALAQLMRAPPLLPPRVHSGRDAPQVRAACALREPHRGQGRR